MFLTEKYLDVLMETYPDITMIGLMGGDSDHQDVIRICNYIHNKFNKKVGMYSGQDSIDLDLASCLDYYKTGRWIFPSGPKEE